MKRSKIFLGTTAALLAVVGVFAAKAHHRFNSISAWAVSHRVSGCTVGVQGFYTTQNKNNTAILAYTQYSESACVTPLYTSGE